MRDGEAVLEPLGCNVSLGACGWMLLKRSDGG